MTCLAEISPDDLEAMGYHDLVDQVQENLEIWRFLHRLEKLNIPLDYEAFKSQNMQVFYLCLISQQVFHYKFRARQKWAHCARMEIPKPWV